MEPINVAVTVAGVPIEMGMNVPAETVKLRAMLPILHQMSNAFINAAEASIQEEGKEISCKAGCGACCRQLVPVSESEAFDLRVLVESMPEPRRSEIISRFSSTMETLNAAEFFERLDAVSIKGEDAYEEILREYFRFGIACPFLENESCSIHESRPITCREYLVTSPAELCNSAEGEGIANVRHYFQLKEALISVARNKTPEELPYVPLVRVLDWTKESDDDSPTQTGKEWVAALFDFLVRHSKPA